VLGEPIGQSLGQNLLNGDTLPTLPGQPAALLVNGERNVRIEMTGNHDGLRAAWLAAAARRVLRCRHGSRSGAGRDEFFKAGIGLRRCWLNGSTVI
jgi:hypothetical protein